MIVLFLMFAPKAKGAVRANLLLMTKIASLTFIKWVAFDKLCFRSCSTSTSLGCGGGGGSLAFDFGAFLGDMGARMRASQLGDYPTS